MTKEKTVLFLFLFIMLIGGGYFSRTKEVQKHTLGVNYQRAIVSYKSDGLKIYALLTTPNTKKPETGFPVIIFSHV